VDQLSPNSIRRPLWRAFAVGLVHGLARSAAIALLVLGMALITIAIAAPMTLAVGRLAGIHQGIVTGSGLLSFGLGLFLAYQLGVVDHLFGAIPLWTPQ
jgi:hypothetical protein